MMFVADRGKVGQYVLDGNNRLCLIVEVIEPGYYIIEMPGMYDACARGKHLRFLMGWLL